LQSSFVQSCTCVHSFTSSSAKLEIHPFSLRKNLHSVRLFCANRFALAWDRLRRVIWRIAPLRRRCLSLCSACILGIALFNAKVHSIFGIAWSSSKKHSKPRVQPPRPTFGRSAGFVYRYVQRAYWEWRCLMQGHIANLDWRCLSQYFSGKCE